MSPNPPLRHRNQQGSVSTKATKALALYAQDVEARLGERTAPEYVSGVRSFLVWLAGRGIELHEVGSEDLHGYQAELLSLRKKDGSAFSVGFHRNRLRMLRSFFRFLYRRGMKLNDPAAVLASPPAESRLPAVVLSKAEAKRLIEAAKEKSPTGLRDRAILETLYATGVRASELASLTPYDVDTDEGLLRVVRGKGRRDRSVPLTRPASETIEAYLVHGRPKLARPRTAYLFVSNEGGYLHRAILGRIVRQYVQAAGVGKHVTPHTFRHSLATHLLKNRADIRHIQALLGHARLSTTERYTRVEVTDLKRVVRRAHPRAR